VPQQEHNICPVSIVPTLPLSIEKPAFATSLALNGKNAFISFWDEKNIVYLSYILMTGALQRLFSKANLLSFSFLS